MRNQDHFGIEMSHVLDSVLFIPGLPGDGSIPDPENTFSSKRQKNVQKTCLLTCKRQKTCNFEKDDFL